MILPKLLRFLTPSFHLSPYSCLENSPNITVTVNPSLPSGVTSFKDVPLVHMQTFLHFLALHHPTHHTLYLYSNAIHAMQRKSLEEFEFLAPTLLNPIENAF